MGCHPSFHLSFFLCCFCFSSLRCHPRLYLCLILVPLVSNFWASPFIVSCQHIPFFQFVYNILLPYLCLGHHPSFSLIKTSHIPLVSLQNIYSLSLFSVCALFLENFLQGIPLPRVYLGQPLFLELLMASPSFDYV